MSDEQKEVLFKNTAADFDAAPEFIKIRHIRNCYKAHKDYGLGVAKAANIPWEKIEE